MNDPKIAKAGKLLCVDGGEYSDYGVVGFFVVLRDFDPLAELAAHLDAQPEQRESYAFSGDSYVAALLAKGLLLEVDYGSLYLGSYSSYAELRFTPGAGG